MTLTTSTTYSAAITPFGGPTTTVVGTLSNTSGDHTIRSLDFVVFDNGTQPQNAAYFNDLAIASPVPLPKSAAAGAVLLGGFGLAAVTRRIRVPVSARRVLC